MIIFENKNLKCEYVDGIYFLDEKGEDCIGKFSKNITNSSNLNNIYRFLEEENTMPNVNEEKLRNLIEEINKLGKEEMLQAIAFYREFSRDYKQTIDHRHIAKRLEKFFSKLMKAWYV